MGFHPLYFLLKMRFLPKGALRTLTALIGPWAILLPFVYMGFIFFLSSLHGGQQDLPLGYSFHLDPALSNFLHFPLYYGLGMLWKLTFEVRQVPERKGTALACVFGTVYGALDELHQWFVPDRYMDARDVVVDFLGVLFACLTWRYVRPIFLSAPPRAELRPQ
jgi:VanZ family protein